MSEITLQEQIEAVLRATHDAVDHGIEGDVDRLCAAAETLRELQKRRTPYSEFCRHPDKCEGLGCCPRDPTCAD